MDGWMVGDGVLLSPGWVWQAIPGVCSSSRSNVIGFQRSPSIVQVSDLLDDNKSHRAQDHHRFLDPFEFIYTVSFPVCGFPFIISSLPELPRKKFKAVIDHMDAAFIEERR